MTTTETTGIRRTHELACLMNKWNEYRWHLARRPSPEEMHEQLRALAEELGGYTVPGEFEAPPAGEQLEWDVLFPTGRSYVVIAHETGAELHVGSWPIVDGEEPPRLYIAGINYGEAFAHPKFYAPQWAKFESCLLSHRGSRAERISDALRHAMLSIKVDELEVDAVALVNAEWMANNSTNWVRLETLFHAWQTMGLVVSPPIPSAVGGAPDWEQITVTRHRRTVKTPFYRMALEMVIFSRESLFALVELLESDPLPEATRERPLAPDFAAAERLGGIAPVRLSVLRPIAGRWVSCTDEVLATIPAVMGHASPNAGEQQGNPPGLRLAKPLPGGTPND